MLYKYVVGLRLWGTETGILIKTLKTLYLQATEVLFDSLAPFQLFAS